MVYNAEGQVLIRYPVIGLSFDAVLQNAFDL